MTESRLFKPLKVGNVTLQHRMALAPLTRYRADDDHVPTPMQREYYRQRGSTPGTLLITEATFMAWNAGGYGNVPGIYNDAQIAAWRTVTDAVHAQGSFIFCQLWHLGRTAHAAVAAKEGFTIKSSSAVLLEGDKHVVPEAMTTEEVRQTVQDYATAARNAIAAGFDGVEIHGANGYLIDQFIQDTVNQRTDEYGGSIENRSRFAVEVVEAVVAAVGAERTAIRLSPWSTFQGMRMEDPVSQFSDLLRKINPHKLAYVHFVQAYSIGGQVAGGRPDETLDWAVEVLDVPILIAGGLESAADAKKLVDETYPNKDIVAVFGRYFISTPDLPFRIQKGIELSPWDFSTFYVPKAAKGYIDHPFSKEFEAAYGAQLHELPN